MENNFKNATWLAEPELQKLLQLLEGGGNEARIVGGTVRNAILGEQIGDIDIATTQLPKATIAIGKKLKYKIITAGEKHGTIILCKSFDKSPDKNSGKKNLVFEITTLRRDIKTDGRHAKIIFGKNWLEDAKRRDFTMNALYVDRHGKLYDPLNAIADLQNGKVKFIGNADLRIKEDYLRILRFFRFHAFYGKSRPDADGLKACVRLRDGLLNLSSERIWQELHRLLQAPNPSISLLWLRQSGVLATVLPQSQNYGLDIFQQILLLEKKYRWQPDSFLRFLALIPPNINEVLDIKKRFKFSNKQTARLENRIAAENVDWNVANDIFLQKLYSQNSILAVYDCLYLQIAKAHAHSDAELVKQLLAKLQLLENYQRPQFPIKAQDLFALGFSQGKLLGTTLKQLESTWVAANFSLSKKQLLAKLKSNAK